MVIVHNFYILESDGAANYTVYSGPSAKKTVRKKFKTAHEAKEFLRNLPA